MKIQKKLALVIILSALLFAPVYFGLAAGFAGINLSPQAGSYKVGQNFNVVISVDPGTEKIDMVRAKLTYPADLLEIKSFTTSSAFGFQAGGNNFDNVAGTFSWGAGAVGGITTANKFGTIVFAVKKEGSAKISVTSDSLVLSAGENKFSGQLSSSAFSLLPTVLAQAQKTTAKTVAKADNFSQAVSAQPITDNNLVDTQVAQNLQPKTFTASLLNGFSLKFMLVAGGVMLALLIILFLVSYILQSRKKNIKNKI